MTAEAREIIAIIRDAANFLEEHGDHASPMAINDIMSLKARIDAIEAYVKSQPGDEKAIISAMFPAAEQIVNIIERVVPDLTR